MNRARLTGHVEVRIGSSGARECLRVLARNGDAQLLKRSLLQAQQHNYKEEEERAGRQARDPSAAVQLVLRVEPPRAGDMASLVQLRTSSLRHFGRRVLEHLVGVAAPLLFAQPIAHGCAPRQAACRGRPPLTSSHAHGGQEVLRQRRHHKRVLAALLPRFRAPDTYASAPLSPCCQLFDASAASQAAPPSSAAAPASAPGGALHGADDAQAEDAQGCRVRSRQQDSGGAATLLEEAHSCGRLRKTLEGLLEQARRFVSGVELKSDAPMVLLQGVPGCGRSSLLAQFVHEMATNKLHHSRSVAVGSAAAATIAHGVRVPVGAAYLPEHASSGPLVRACFVCMLACLHVLTCAHMCLRVCMYV